MDMPDEAGPPISELMERWLAGDRTAGDEICRRYHDRAWRFAMKITGREADADDLAQEALAAGLEGIQQGTKPDRFTRWILGIARHLAAREWRNDRPMQETEKTPALSHGPPTELVRDEMNRFLAEALSKLAETDRTALRLRVEERLKRPAVAARLGVRPNALDRKMDRILADLRGALSRHFTTLVLTRALPAGKTPPTLEAVEKLRPSFRRVFELRYLDGKPEDELAALLGVPIETVRLRLKHACEQLKCAAEDDFSALREEYRARGGSA